MPKQEQYYCEKCNRTKNKDNFYQSNNLEKYPDGVLHQCKECLTMHVDNWDPDTYTWILQECDVPYIPDEWNKLMATYAKDRSSVTGMTIIGRYLSKMKLKQYKIYRWKDTQFLQELANSKIEQAMKRQGYDAQQITQAIEKASFSIPEEVPIPVYNDPPPEQQYDYFDQMNGIEDNTITDSLTDEDKLYLRMKWGKAYKPDEWVQLEKLYNEMCESYDIQSAGHIDTLKMICKTSLKSNQLLDMGDVDGAQKMVKMYDMLMKSGKFTAAQNKAEKGEYVDSVSELVAICEKEGFIPRYYVDKPQDKVDRCLQDMQTYTRSLVMEEMNLGNLIENAVKQIQVDKEKENQRDADAADDESLDAELFDEPIDFMTDNDYVELQDQIEEEQIDDEEFLESLIHDKDML